MTELSYADTPAGRFRTAMGITAPPAPTAEARRRGLELAREQAADRWARYGTALPGDDELRRLADALTPRPPAPADPPSDVGELVTRCHWGIAPDVAPCGQRHTASRQGPDGLWRFVLCGCLDIRGTDAWRARQERAAAEAGIKREVAGPTRDGEW